MNAKMLCTWLGIVDWPPDHYALLGLQPGEGDALRIEQHVQERMTKLRCYQLSYPEEATEGMNRVAQAFICLTEALSKQVAPVTNPSANGPPPKTKAPPSPTETPRVAQGGDRIGSDWKTTPPPVRTAKDGSGPPEVAAPPGLKSVPVAAPVAPVVPAAREVDPIFELAQQSTEARRGLGTLPALIERINQTRTLILAWNQAGKYLKKPVKKITRLAEEADLTRRLNKIFELTAEFPKIVGHPGQPGYRVVAMARLEMTAEMFKMLDKTQREDLCRDWEAGYRVLLVHRQFLRSQFKVLRRRGRLSLVMKAIRGAVNDHPLLVALAALVAVGLSAFVIWQVF